MYVYIRKVRYSKQSINQSVSQKVTQIVCESIDLIGQYFSSFKGKIFYSTFVLKVLTSAYSKAGVELISDSRDCSHNFSEGDPII